MAEARPQAEARQVPTAEELAAAGRAELDAIAERARRREARLTLEGLARRVAALEADFDGLRSVVLEYTRAAMSRGWELSDLRDVVRALQRSADGCAS